MRNSRRVNCSDRRASRVKYSVPEKHAQNQANGVDIQQRPQLGGEAGERRPRYCIGGAVSKGM